MRVCLCPHATGNVERHTAYHSQGSVEILGTDRRLLLVLESLPDAIILCQISNPSFNVIKKKSSQFILHSYKDTLIEKILWTLIKCNSETESEVANLNSQLDEI